jgi:hypothetical protein
MWAIFPFRKIFIKKDREIFLETISDFSTLGIDLIRATAHVS